MTCQEKLDRNLAKRRAKMADIEKARLEGWRQFDNAKECFMKAQVPREEAFPEFKLRNGTTVLKIFLSFVTLNLTHHIFYLSALLFEDVQGSNPCDRTVLLLFSCPRKPSLKK